MTAHVWIQVYNAKLLVEFTQTGRLRVQTNNWEWHTIAAENAYNFTVDGELLFDGTGWTTPKLSYHRGQVSPTGKRLFEDKLVAAATKALPKLLDKAREQLDVTRLISEAKGRRGKQVKALTYWSPLVDQANELTGVQQELIARRQQLEGELTKVIDELEQVRLKLSAGRRVADHKRRAQAEVDNIEALSALRAILNGQRELDPKAQTAPAAVLADAGLGLGDL